MKYKFKSACLGEKKGNVNCPINFDFNTDSYLNFQMLQITFLNLDKLVNIPKKL